MSRIDDIRKRYNDNGLTENQYKAIKTHQIAQMRVDIKHLLYELDCVTKERDAAVEDWKLAVECAGSLLACNACNHLKYDIVDGRYCELKSCKPEWPRTRG